MESAAKYSDNYPAIVLKNDLLAVVEEDANPQPSPPQTVALPMVIAGKGEIEESCENNQIIKPPLLLDAITKPCDTEMFIREKVENVIDLPAIVKTHENLGEKALQQSGVATTNRENYEKVQLKKLGVGEESRVYFLEQIKKYRDLLVNSTGFVDPNRNQEINTRLTEITRFFSDTASSCTLWVVTPVGITIGGIQTNVQFPLFLEYYVLGRNAQLARGPPPPFYEKLTQQIVDYLHNRTAPPVNNVNPFAGVGQDQHNSDDEDMYSYDDAEAEMHPLPVGANPLPNPENMDDMDKHIQFVNQFVESYMPVSSDIPAILIYLSLGGFDIIDYAQYKRIFRDVVFNSQNQLNVLIDAYGPIAQFGYAGDQDELPIYESPDEELEMTRLPFSEQVERWPEQAQQIRIHSASGSSSTPHPIPTRDDVILYSDADRMITAPSASSRNLSLNQRASGRQSDYGGAFGSENSLGTSKRHTRSVRHANLEFERGLAESNAAYKLHAVQFPHHEHYQSALQPDYSQSIVASYADRDPRYKKVTQMERYRTRILPMNRGAPSITETLLNPVGELNLGPVRPPKSLTTNQRFAIQHSVRPKIGVAGPKAPSVIAARTHANAARVYPFDPLDQRPPRGETLTQRHTASRRIIDHPKTHHVGREKSRIPAPFHQAEIHPNKLQAALHRKYGQRKRDEFNLQSNTRGLSGKYLDSRDRRAIAAAAPNTVTQLNRWGEFESIQPSFKQPTPLFYPYRRAPRALRRARAQSLPETTASFRNRKKAKFDDSKRNPTFAVPEIPHNRRRLPPFAHVSSPSLADRLSEIPTVDPRMAELALAHQSGQSVTLASSTRTKSFKTPSSKTSAKSMKSVSGAQAKGKQRVAKKVVKVKTPSKPAKAKKTAKNKQAIATTIKHAAYKLDAE